MIFLSYQIGCRNCLQSDGIKRMYSVINGKLSEYENKTEHEVAKKLEKWRNEDGHKCDFCGSSNTEVLEVEVDNFPLYNFDRIVKECNEKGEYSFMLNIDKRGAQINLTPGGSRKIDAFFLAEALELTLQTIKENSSIEFKAHQVGNFFVAITGGPNLTPVAKVQRFRSAGFTADELLKAITSFFNK